MAKGISLANSANPVKADGFVRIQRETKGRKGAGVTIVSGLCENNDELKALAKQLKKLCSSGGAIKAEKLEVQGDHRQKIKDWLEKQGRKVKLVGG